MNFLVIYIIIGFIWLILWDIVILRMPNNRMRLQYLFLWPIMLIVVIVGVTQIWNNRTNK